MPVEWITTPKGKLLKIVCPKTGEVKYLDEASFDVMVDVLGFEVEDIVNEVCGFKAKKPRAIEIL
jgi:hypothetical protein